MSAGAAWIRRGWIAAVLLAIASRVWNALAMTVLRGYDSVGHVGYVYFLDLYHAIPYADQGWSLFHPPLHYLLGWALAQSGSAQVLVRGLALVGSAASLLTAALAAWTVRLGLPGRPGLPLLAFVAVAFLPVQVYSSTMPGNELSAALLCSATIALHLRNETRERPTLAGDLATGLFGAAALLTKFSGLLPLVAVCGVTLVRALGRPPRALARAGLRIAVISGVATLLCLPYYARNVAEYGTPFQLHRDFEPGRSLEATQPPGERSWRDLIRFPLHAFLDPDPEAEPLLHSIPGSVYVNAWYDTRPEVEPSLGPELVISGLVPTALALLGLLACARRALRTRDAPDLAMALLAPIVCGALVVMAYRIPTFAVLKASYLLPGSLAWGYCVASGVEALSSRRRLAGAASAWVVGVGLLGAIASTPGLLHPIEDENERMAAVYDYFGDHQRALAIFERRIGEAKRADRRILMREYLANAYISAGKPELARRIYDARKRLFGAPPHLEPVTSPWWINRRAVATALAGDRAGARALLDKVLERSSQPPLLVNRAALRALAGDLDGAEGDLRAALAGEPGLAAALYVRAWIQEQRGDLERAERTLHEAKRQSLRAPRGFPYGVGDGFNLNGQRFMLVIQGGKLALYRPGRARNAP